MYQVENCGNKRLHRQLLNAYGDQTRDEINVRVMQPIRDI